jgi:hypothetical protein
MNAQAAVLFTIGLYLVATGVWCTSDRRGTSFRNAAIGAIALLVAGIDRATWTSFKIVEQIRQLAQEQGWYHKRQLLQKPLTVLFAVLAVSVFVYAIVQQKKENGPRVSLKVASLITLLAFCCIRTVSQHTVDYWLVSTIAGFRIHWLIEWSLLCATIYFCRRE